MRISSAGNDALENSMQARKALTLLRADAMIIEGSVIVAFSLGTSLVRPSFSMGRAIRETLIISS
jgi:hypothetical protein